MSTYTGWLTRYPVVVTSTPTGAEIRVKNSPDEVIIEFRLTGNSGDLWEDTVSVGTTFLDRSRLRRVKVPSGCWAKAKHRAIGAMANAQKKKEEYEKNYSFDLDNSRLASDDEIIEAFASDWR